MPLTFIGTGISFDLTLSGIEELKACDNVYWEGYTGLLIPEQIDPLAKKIGKPFTQLKREQVESRFLLDQAKTAKIALLVSGDPLTATTHIALVLEAKKAGITVRLIPNSSIYTTAAGKAGLQIYRFGKTVSLVNPRPNYNPTSAFDSIRENLSANLHTLILLDTEPEPMEAQTALKMLKRAGFEKERFVVLSRLGFPDEKIAYGTLAVLNGRTHGRPPFCLILPAKLHIVEEEFLELLEV